jgi:thiamine-phosphate pyrophosphorylase
MLPAVYPILDTATLLRLGFPCLDAAEALLEGGAKILQFRHKAFWGRDVFAEAGQVAALCRGAGVPFVVNDRADYAAMIGAGLHVGQDDLSPTDARKVVGATATVGFSTHNVAQMAAALSEPVDYVAFGPVFPTASKENPDPVAGLDGLRAVRALTALPLVAIGGITRENAHLCWEAGADSVAVIADLYSAVSFPLSSSLSGPAMKRSLRERMSEWKTLQPHPTRK